MSVLSVTGEAQANAVVMEHPTHIVTARLGVR